MIVGRPRLYVSHWRARNMVDAIYVADGWFWWGWPERIARITDVGRAAAEIAEALRFLDRP